MSTVIKVENLSKRYRLGLKENRKDTLMGQIGQTLRAPLDNFKRLRSMTRFDQEDDSVFWALRDINFEVKQGEVLGIIGHNGAGKSTLLKILSRITEPTDGRILVNGRIAALLEVGTGFHQDLSGRENIYMNGTILGMTRKEIDRKLDEIVDFSGVEKHLDTPVKFYSSGMKVRLGFAVAAHLEPEILIIDEVLAVGDAEFQKKCLGKMESVAGEGRTVLFVSHDMGAISSLTNICVLLDSGEISKYGNTEDVINKYLFKNKSFSNYDQISYKNINAKVIVKQLNIQSTQDILDFGSDIRIEITIKSKNDLPKMLIFMRIENIQGEIIAAINSVDDMIYLDFNEGEMRVINFEISRLNILPGSYFITLALQDQYKEVIEVFPYISSFEVTTAGVPNRYINKKNNVGKLYLFGEWIV